MLPLLLPLLWAALTDTPDIHIQGTLASGRPTSFTYAVPWACDRGTPPTFSWTGVALTYLHPESPCSSVLTAHPHPEAPGPQHQPHMSCELFRSQCEHSGDHQAQCVLPRDPGQYHLPATPGGPVPAPGLCRRQQPPRQCKLGPGEPDPEPLPAFGSCGPRAAPGGLRGWRRGHLQSSAPERLQPCVLTPSGTGCLLFLPPQLWGESGLLAPGPHPAEEHPGGGWFPPCL